MTETQNSKKPATVLNIEILYFPFVSNFEFQISSFI
jgi:hypothetical protein